MLVCFIITPCKIILSAITSMAIAQPTSVPVVSGPNYQTYASASAAATAPQQLPYLQLLQNTPLGLNGPLINPVQVNLGRTQQGVPQQRVDTRLVNQNAFGVPSYLSASSSASASSVSPQPISISNRILNSLQVQPVQAVQSQSRQQVGNPLISSTRLLQSQASVSRTGASSSSSVQVLGSQNLNQQQNVGNVRQNVNGAQLGYGYNGPIFSAPVLLY